MKDIKRLNDILDGDVDVPVPTIKLQDDVDQSVPVVCVFEGQVPTKNIDRAVFWNCFPGIVMGFITTTVGN